MAVPELTPEERQQALEKRRLLAIKRAQVREDLKNGTLTLKDVLAMKDDPIVGRMKASTLIETLPGYGKAKAEKNYERTRHCRVPSFEGFGRTSAESLA